MHFYKAASVVFTCVGIGSTCGSICKSRIKHVLEVSPQKGHRECGAHTTSLLLVLTKWPLVQETPLFVRVYRSLLMDRRDLQNKKRAESFFSHLVSVEGSWTLLTISGWAGGTVFPGDVRAAVQIQALHNPVAFLAAPGASAPSGIVLRILLSNWFHHRSICWSCPSVALHHAFSVTFFWWLTPSRQLALDFPEHVIFLLQVAGDVALLESLDNGLT